MSVFKAYDIRGIWGKEIDEDLCYKAGYFLPGLLGANEVIVGRDIRLSSEAAYQALVQGITDSGADVLDLGLSTTPMVCFALVYLSAGASVQITASHNPPEYNGLKINSRGAVPVGGDSGLKELEKRCMNWEAVPVKKPGVVKNASYIKDAYIAFLKDKSDDYSSIRMSIDCSSGVASLIVKDILPDADYINDSFDGTFSAHEPNPLDERNCRALEEEVLKNHSDIGIIYDGDADRVVFVDEKGRFIQPDYMIAVLGLYYASKGMKGNALQDIRTSRSTTEYLESLGFNVHTWKVGHAFAKKKLREIGGIFGGELAGHYYLGDFYCCDSGILASLHILTVLKGLKEDGRTLSGLIDSIVKYPNSGEVNFRLEHKDEAIQALYDAFAPSSSRILDFDGYRIEYPDWWFNVRKSNTEPYLRIVAEAETEELLQSKLDRIREIIGRFS